MTEFSRDLRLPMMPSLIKAAYLTLFDLLGYRYALSGAGRFVGGDILGRFFLHNRSRPKPEVLRDALPFFREFVHMVRPIISCTFECQGSITDRTFFLCMGSSGQAWGLIVFVRTADILHGVLMPVYESADQAVTYLDFLENPNTSIRVACCRFEDERWEICRQTMPVIWPKSGMELD